MFRAVVPLIRLIKPKAAACVGQTEAFSLRMNRSPDPVLVDSPVPDWSDRPASARKHPEDAIRKKILAKLGGAKEPTLEDPHLPQFPDRSCRPVEDQP